MSLITVLNQLSSINFKNSNFSYIDATHSFMIVGIKPIEATFDNCRFIQCGNPLSLMMYSKLPLYYVFIDNSSVVESIKVQI